MHIRLNRRILLSLLLATAWTLPPMPTIAQAGNVQPVGRPAAVMLELAAPPAAAVYAAQAATVDAAAAAAVTQAHVATLLAAQQAVRAELGAHNVTELYSLQRVYNGIAVLVADGAAPALAALPGVVAIHPIIAKQPDYLDPLPHLGTAAFWDSTEIPGGLHGEGLRLAIIDTGVDYFHTHFAGPGIGYTQNDTRVAGDVAGYPGTRVVGGHDFVGDDYNADSSAITYQPIPKPDADPMDCYGHGTHVAGTAAGNGVIAGGATYMGPYTGGPASETLEIAPGLAPKASIYALKIFGCSGSSDFADLALEWSVDPNNDGDFSDRMDVVNLSLGSPYGSAYDTTSVAADNAAAAGVVVVASAGNSGDNHFVVGSPATAGRAIAVAATQHSTGRASQVATDLLPTFSARGPRRGDAALKPDLAAPGVAIISAASGTGNGNRALSGTSMAAPHVAGAMVLLRQLHPDWQVEELKALVMNTAMPLVRTSDALTSTLYSPARIGAGRIDLARAAAASTIAMVVEEPGQVGISFGAPDVRGTLMAVRNVQIANKGTVTATYDLAYTPITDLPGVTIEVLPASVTIPPGSNTTVAVVLRAEGATMRHLRDATAADPFAISEAWLAEEAGHLWLWPAENFLATLQASGDAPATPAGATGTATLRFDPATNQLQYEVTLTGLHSGDVSVTQLVAGRHGQEGLVLYPLTPPFSVSAQNSIISGTLALTARDALLLASGMMQVRVGLAAEGAGTLRGQFAVTTPPLHLPVYAAPHPVADLAAVAPTLEFSPGALVRTIELAGQGLAAVSAPTGVLSLVTPVGLHLQSPNSRPLDMTDVEQDRYDHADLQYVGAVVDMEGPPEMPVSMLFFGLATYAPWSTPNEVTFSIYLDVNRDGTDDYRLYNADVVHASSAAHYSDAFVSVLEDLATGQKLLQKALNNMPANQFDPGLFFGSSMVLPVKLEALNLDRSGRFDYRVESFSADRSGRIDVTPILQVDTHAAALHISHDQPTTPFLAALPGDTLQVEVDLPAYARQPVQSILLLHHHNRPDRQAEVIPTHMTWPNVVGLPYVGK